jgi:hypothetical protein
VALKVMVYPEPLIDHVHVLPDCFGAPAWAKSAEYPAETLVKVAANPLTVSAPKLVSAPVALVPGPLKTGAASLGAFVEEAEVGPELFEQPANRIAVIARIPAVFENLDIISSCLSCSLLSLATNFR